jgi:glycosyltransferase involved in cell wall biosynthesis
VLEAFAAGLPVVSTPTGELAAMVREGDTGSIVSAENPEAMAAAIARLLTEADGALAMARRARVEVENYTWQAVHQEWLAAYSGRRA